jgi:hypothetical protein
MALSVVALIVAIVALSDVPTDNTTGPDDAAPTAAVAAEASPQHADAGDQGFAANGSDGRTYECPASALDELDAADDKAKRRTKVLKARRAAVRGIEKQYPSGNAPAAAVERYDRLFARANAQVKWVNRAVREYDHVLRSQCAPD